MDVYMRSAAACRQPWGWMHMQVAGSWLVRRDSCLLVASWLKRRHWLAQLTSVPDSHTAVCSAAHDLWRPCVSPLQHTPHWKLVLQGPTRGPRLLA